MGNRPPLGVERRRRLVVNKAVQGRLVGLMALFAFLTALLVFLAEFVLTGRAMWLVVARLSGALLIVLIGAGFIGLRYTQRIAGPIYAFARTLVQIGRGEYADELRLRKHDHFQNLAAAFNQAMAALRAGVEKDLAFLDRLDQAVQGLSGGDAAAKEALLAQIREQRAAKEAHLKKRSGS